MRLLFWLAVSLGFAAPASASSEPQMVRMERLGQLVNPASLGLNSAALEQLRNAMNQLVESKARAGITYGVMYKGQLVALESFGHRDIENRSPMTATTVVRIFSMSRALSSAAILTLVEEKKISLDDPVSKFIPTFANTPVLIRKTCDLADQANQSPPMTLRHLFTYTAGFGYASDWPQCFNFTMGDVLNPQQSTEAGIEKLARVPLLHQPGQRWRYGFASDVLGRVAEVVTGQPLDMVLQERLFDPLRMIDTGFWVDPADANRLARAYGPGDSGPLTDVTDRWSKEYGTFDKPIHFFSAGGGLVSTLVDYLRFAQMLVNGGELNGVRVLQPETVSAMLSRQTTAEQGLANADDTAWGLGIGVKTEAAQRPYGHSGREAGWGGLMNTYFLVDTENEIAAVAMTQYLGPEAAVLGQTLRRGVYNALPR